MSTATRVTLSYPSDLSAWGRDQLQTPWFTAYLRRKLGRAEPGEEHAEFLDVGCCGDSLDVTLRVVSVEGGDAVGESTTVEWTEHEACGVQGGWRVQSAGGPTT